ncbi:MAG: FAD-dependent oxidoreductase, partial [Nanoarchaeota archaeon]
MRLEDIIKTDAVVIGGGSAGCSAALELADAGKRVELFTKGSSFEDSNSHLIAGGLAAVPLVNMKPLEGDSFEQHVQDTLNAGKGLNDIGVVEYCVRHFFDDVIMWLVKKGVGFDGSTNQVGYDLHKEGGHSANRVFHSSDATGVKIMGTLGRLVEAHPNITVYKNHMAIDLITKNWIADVWKERDECLGCYVYDIRNNHVKTVAAKSVFIATGGLGKVFSYTSNPDIATGDGVAMCYRAGLPLANMEFIQFHPTVFYDPAELKESGRRVLFTEALRGAGAILKLTKDGKEDFVRKYDPEFGSNSSRDVVTRAEDVEMRENGLDHVWLDCTGIEAEKLRNEFNAFYSFCISKGIDPTKEAVPVVYAVHYSNGGVLVGRNGETMYDGKGLQNCYVIGESAYTGLHGATRLASNSGPEAVLYGRLAAKHFLEQRLDGSDHDIPLWNESRAKEPRDKATIDYCWDTIRKTMTKLCGISRNETRMRYAKTVLTALNQQVSDFYWSYFVTKDALEVRNILAVANAILDSALLRKETRACHAREDFSETSEGYAGLSV